MKLEPLEFDILVYIESHQSEKITQAKLSQVHNAALGTINKKIALLKNLGFIEEKKKNYQVTAAGYEYLEPYRVKRAILIAAGFGSRLIPITLNTPKPLVRVKNKKIIETLLDALIDKGIEDITIVRGYLGEQFDLLKTKYPNLKLVYNEEYNTANNISSALRVKELFGGAYVMEADLFLMNPELIRKYECYSNYLGVPVERTDDWRFIMKRGRITGMKIGGENCYQMVGISYWSDEDGKAFEKDVVDVYRQPGGREFFWDNVVLGDMNKHYDIHVRPCRFEDVIEIDTFAELKAFDPVYAQ